MPRVGAVTLAVALCAVLTGCGMQIPTDPDGTLDRVRGGELRAGATASGELVTVQGDEVGGTLTALVEQYAESVDARVVWTVDSEEDLVAGLEDGDLDLAIGGMTAGTPWAEQVGVTRGYTGIPGSGGAAVVMLLPMGENAWLASLETFLDEEVGP